MGSPPQDGVSTVEGLQAPARSLLLQENQSFGDYRIVRLLGRGGMGEVYEADDLVNGRRVALKVVNVARSSPVALQRFLREGELAASLSHPNTVYVFASGEIDGIPYIVSELVSGGTLADRVRASGPLPVSHAVDAILDVIAGLEAAADLGILHRDVKPSNCFAPDEGAVKIGDFGVSIPLDASERTELTLTGVIVGTPTYCAPEQLKGEQLDVRSDIYSVGATLFYLLVGHPPFRDTDVVRLIEQVLVAAPDRLTRRRPDVPKRLSEIVAACLSKKREHRPATYDALAAALKPFSSVPLTPASPAPRALAALLDALLLVVIWNVTSGLLREAVPSGSNVFGLQTAVRAVVTLAYFALSEYSWGASPGKLLCGLRVANEYGSRVGFWPAVARAAIVFAALSVPTPVAVLGRYVLMSPGPIGLAVALLLFVSARRTNGYSGVHELLTGTRTWEAPSSRYARGDLGASSGLPPLASGESIGPYRVAQRFDRDSTLVLARDERLKRPIWLRLASANEAPVSSARRDLDRPQRFRWLGAKRGALESWDAYEHADGRPFVQLDADRLPFQTVARWLLALAHECRAASADGTLPLVALNRLWITRRGDLKIADWPLPGVATAGDAYRAGDLGSCQAFLATVAATVLERSRSAPMPVYGRTLLTAIGARSFADFDDLVAACERAAARDATLSMERRLAPIVAASVFASIPLVVVLVSIPQVSLIQLRNLQRIQLGVCVRELRAISEGAIDDPSSVKRQAAEMCAAAASRETGARMLADFRRDNPDSVSLLEAALARYPSVPIADLEARQADMPATFDVRKLRRESAARLRRDLVAAALRDLGHVPITLLAALGTIAIVWALLLTEGPIYRLLGIAVVHSDGSRVSRMRVVARAVVIWLPALIAWAMLPAPYTDEPWQLAGAWLPLVVMAVAAVYAARHPTRGIPERLTGTYLVRR